MKQAQVVPILEHSQTISTISQVPRDTETHTQKNVIIKGGRTLVIEERVLVGRINCAPGSGI